MEVDQEIESLKKQFVGKVYVNATNGKPTPANLNGRQIFTDSDIKLDSFRVLGPMDPMTRDYRQDRVNFHLNNEQVCDRLTRG